MLDDASFMGQGGLAVKPATKPTVELPKGRIRPIYQAVHTFLGVASMNTLRLLAVLILGLALAVPAHAASRAAAPKPAPSVPTEMDPNAKSLLDFFKTEEAASPKSLDFSIDGGYADIRTDRAESSGRYFLAGHAVTRVAPDIYKLDMTFKKKFQRDVIDLAPEHFFTQQRQFYFWYSGGDKIVFKIGSGKKEVKIAKKELTEIKVRSLETYTIEKTKLTMDMSLSDGSAKIALQIRFN